MGGTAWRWPTTYLETYQTKQVCWIKSGGALIWADTTLRGTCRRVLYVWLVVTTVLLIAGHACVPNKQCRNPTRPQQVGLHTLARCHLQAWLALPKHIYEVFSACHVTLADRTHCVAVLPVFTSRQHMRSTSTWPSCSIRMYSSVMKSMPPPNMGLALARRMSMPHAVM